MDTYRYEWKEPNRRNTPPLHIAKHGTRYSTLTGVYWLDNEYFVVNHRSGLRVALFSKQHRAGPLLVAEIPHLTDDISAKKIDDQIWEIAVSGCWDCAYSLFEINVASRSIKILETCASKDHTFCHGVGYDNSGILWMAMHTGKNPRIENIAGGVWKLPKPWGARDICFDDLHQKAYAVAVNSNPKLTSYGNASISIWEYHLDEPKRIFFKQKWKKIIEIDNAHTDACAVYDGKIWLPDQSNDRVLAVTLTEDHSTYIINHKDFDFPHGLSISDEGMVAVSNYGSSDVILFDANNAL